MSGCDIELAGPGYRFSLIKKRFAAGQINIHATWLHATDKHQGHELPSARMHAHMHTLTQAQKELALSHLVHNSSRNIK